VKSRITWRAIAIQQPTADEAPEQRRDPEQRHAEHRAGWGQAGRNHHRHHIGEQTRTGNADRQIAKDDRRQLSIAPGNALRRGLQRRRNYGNRRTAHQQPGDRQRRRRQSGKRQISRAPAVLRDHPRGDRRHHHRAEADASIGGAQRKPEMAREPATGQLHIGHRPDADRQDRHDHECGVEQPYVGRQPCHRDQPDDERGDRPQDQPPRTEPVDQRPLHNRHGHDDQRQDDDRGDDRGGRPAEFARQRSSERAEACHQDRARAEHQAIGRSERNAPGGLASGRVWTGSHAPAMRSIGRASSKPARAAVSVKRIYAVEQAGGRNSR